MARIEIIDDDVAFAEDVLVFLKNEGHAVTITDDTEGAIEKLVADTPDLLILDVMFPGNVSAGFDLARAIRQNKSIESLPIILLTAVNQEFPMDFSSNDIDEDWIPVQHFVEKPVDMQELMEKVNKLLHP